MARVLIVDDTQVIREVVSKFLTKEGHAVESVENGQEGIERFKAKPYDLVLTDVEMPGVNGLAVVDAIRDMSAGVPIIVMSATYNGKNFPNNERTVFVSKTDGIRHMMATIHRYLPDAEVRPKSFSFRSIAGIL